MPIFQSGFGDGAYPVYWGIDENGTICQLVIQFIDIQLAYSEETENEEQSAKIEDLTITYYN